MLLVSCVGYWQYQYGIFGNHHAFAILVPAIIITAFAYYFNDRAILSLAITLWAGYLGFTISIPAILYGQNFRSLQLIFTAIIFACVLMALAYAHYHYKKIFLLVLLLQALLSILCVWHCLQVFLISLIVGFGQQPSLLFVLLLCYFRWSSNHMQLLFRQCCIRTLLFLICVSIF